METPDSLYSYFLRALKHCSDGMGHGAQKIIAIDAGISRPLLSQILSGNSIKKASMRTQVNLAKACGYGYENFLDLGRRLENGENPVTHSKSSGINQNSNDAKVGNGMDQVKDDAIILHYRDELAALREEIKYLREERNHFRDRILELEKQQVQAPEEKKTAV